MKQRVHVTGWYDKGNIGDESYKLSFPLVLPDYDLTFSEKVLDKEMPHILGGGDIVCDDFIKALKPIAQKSICSAAISKPINLDSFKKVIIRDNASLQNAKAANYIATYAPDFGFAIPNNIERGKELIRKQFEGIDLYTKTVCVVLNGHLVPQPSGEHKKALLFENFAYQLAKLCDYTSASFIFLPFGRQLPWDDRVAGSWIASKCKFHKKNKIVYDYLNVQDTIDILSACDAMISTRLHSTIFACSSGVPFLDITHNHKNRSFLETVGLTNLSMPYDATTFESMFVKLKSLLAGEHDIRAKLNEITIQQRLLLRDVANHVRFI